jgi:hypothetical protein
VTTVFDWPKWEVNQVKVFPLKTVYELQTAAGKFRKRHPECSEWRWRCVTERHGVVMRRIK